jgi:hypothetical protein
VYLRDCQTDCGGNQGVSKQLSYAIHVGRDLHREEPVQYRADVASERRECSMSDRKACKGD